MKHYVDYTGDYSPAIAAHDVPCVRVKADPELLGGWVVTSGEEFPVTVLVRPVGTLELAPDTAALLSGLFSADYVNDLQHALEQARRIADMTDTPDASWTVEFDGFTITNTDRSAIAKNAAGKTLVSSEQVGDDDGDSWLVHITGWINPKHSDRAFTGFFGPANLDEAITVSCGRRDAGALVVTVAKIAVAAQRWHAHKKGYAS